MKEIKITIRGKAGVGKSIVARELAYYIESHSGNVELIEDDPDINIIESSSHRKFKNLINQKDLKIIIETMQSK